MPRLIEIFLFLAPFIGFAVWRLLFPSPLPPLWLVASLAAFLAAMLAALLWMWHADAGDGKIRYVPARMQDGRVVKPQPQPP
nr:hypothetical protein [uncultured Rhodopila sp.]